MKSIVTFLNLFLFAGCNFNLGTKGDSRPEIFTVASSFQTVRDALTAVKAENPDMELPAELTFGGVRYELQDGVQCFDRYKFYLYDRQQHRIFSFDIHADDQNSDQTTLYLVSVCRIRDSIGGVWQMFNSSDLSDKENRKWIDRFEELVLTKLQQKLNTETEYHKQQP